MDNLRLILIIAGILIIVAIYLWDRYQARNDLERYRPSLPESDEEEGLVITTGTTYDDDVAKELSDLKHFMGESARSSLEGEELDPFIAHEMDLEPDEVPEPDPEELEDGSLPEEEVSGQSRDKAPVDSGKQKIPQQIVVLHIVSRNDEVIKGEDLESVAGTHGFEFGEMDIFHYHGEDNRGKTDSLFSLVNMYEPGYFAPDAMEGFSTRGVSIFASLPVDGTGEPVFRKMLDVTARMAEEMDCVVWGPDKQPLTVDAIKNIYQQISREQSSQA